DGGTDVPGIRQDETSGNMQRSECEDRVGTHEKHFAAEPGKALLRVGRHDDRAGAALLRKEWGRMGPFSSSKQNRPLPRFTRRASWKGSWERPDSRFRNLRRRSVPASTAPPRVRGRPRQCAGHRPPSDAFFRGIHGGRRAMHEKETLKMTFERW